MFAFGIWVSPWVVGELGRLLPSVATVETGHWTGRQSRWWTVWLVKWQACWSNGWSGLVSGGQTVSKLIHRVAWDGDQAHDVDEEPANIMLNTQL